MQTITFECETVTPMFLDGADGATPELRAPSIKGALRFWWRAMHGHLPEEKLRIREGAIFGDTTRRSCFSIQIKTQQDLLVMQTPPVPHKGYTLSAMNYGTSFQVVFSLRPLKTVDFTFGQEHLKSLFEIAVLLGGLGKRVRRGMGSYRIRSINQVTYPIVLDAVPILKLLHQHSSHYALSNGVILANYSGSMLPYGWIHRIEIGNADKGITRKISDATHFLKGEYGQKYEPNLGHASNGRFASPVYVSVLGDGKTPIITTLNTIPDRGKSFLDLSIQEAFKSEIL